MRKVRMMVKNIVKVKKVGCFVIDDNATVVVVVVVVVVYAVVAIVVFVEVLLMKALTRVRDVINQMDIR